MDYTTDSDPAYVAGKIIGIILFPFLVYAVGYWVIRLTQKRKPTPKEKRVLIIVAVIVAVLGVLAQAARGVSENY